MDLGQFYSGLFGLAWDMLDLTIPGIGLTFKQVFMGMFLISCSWLFLSLFGVVMNSQSVKAFSSWMGRKHENENGED